ncbi:MAG TPA: hypothetical protein VNW53_17685 [Phenylobacterium sp.]|jgi:hypothetical protein|uniref:hypothetical protein n=1 Tax=Phenylobacterium sp. TaxID=1871053 RepID=UPI002C34307A|nr:hypothetical protein [Phenylobacterium sp.]HXA40836.1 hypothetical protein [Phenylobacterium sp.]
MRIFIMKRTKAEHEARGESEIQDRQADRLGERRSGWGVCPRLFNQEAVMRSILLFAIGVPLPVILLLAFCTHHF